MAENPDKKPSEASKKALDLNELSGLDFGPNWAADREKTGSQKYRDFPGEGRRGGKGGRGPSADRRGGGSGGGLRDRRSGGGSSSGGQGPGGGSREGGARGFDRGNRRGRSGPEGRGPAPAHFQPTVKVDLYPQDEAFDALIARLRSSARTYQLFDIAQLLLEKPDRFVAVVSPLKKSDSGADLLHYSVPGHLPFETEDEAISYVVAHHIDQFFEVETIEVEPPKGNFQMVNRCGITGKLLGPPNYHRYQEFLRHHYATQISGMSFERFISKVEGVKEAEQIEAWLESMKNGARYTLKDRQEGEPESFESLEAARFFLVSHRKDKVVGSGESVRFAGRDIERLPPGNIRRSVEAYVEEQKVFPLESANNIRGRLRRHKFAVYKKGSKGVSFVCAVKRRFRDSKTVFTDSIRDLINFIEKHPDLPASKLPKQYIGIDTEKQQPEALKMTEAEVEAAAKAKAKVSAETAEKDSAAETSVSESVSDGLAAEPAPEESAEQEGSLGQAERGDVVDPEADVTEKGADVEAADAAEMTQAAPVATTEAKPKAELTEEESKKLRRLMLDLRWLITEGYVTEYGDGRLFAPAPMPDPKPKPAVKKPAAENPVSDVVSAPGQSTVETVTAPVEVALPKESKEAPAPKPITPEITEPISPAAEPEAATDTKEPAEKPTEPEEKKTTD